jgi:hypothetical protein
MRLHSAVFLLLSGIGTVTFLYAQKEFKEYPGQTNVPLPPDYKEPHEWVWGRLRYDNYGGGGFGGGGRRRGGFGGGWGSWATDYSKGDRTLVSALKRLTLIDTRSVEQVIDLDGTDDIYNWPFLYAVEVGRWSLDNDEAKQLRDYIDRGGFFMVDDFHGEDEWQIFYESMEKVFPDADIVDIPQGDKINSIFVELDQQLQVPGRQYVRSRSLSERFDGSPGHWRGIYDDKKDRLVVVIVHNSDLGDAIEYADDPYYPEMFSQQAFRILSNYIIYDLTH